MSGRINQNISAPVEEDEFGDFVQPVEIINAVNIMPSVPTNIMPSKPPIFEADSQPTPEIEIAPQVASGDIYAALRELEPQIEKSEIDIEPVKEEITGNEESKIEINEPEVPAPLMALSTFDTVTAETISLEQNKPRISPLLSLTNLNKITDQEMVENEFLRDSNVLTRGQNSYYQIKKHAHLNESLF